MPKLLVTYGYMTQLGGPMWLKNLWFDLLYLAYLNSNYEFEPQFLTTRDPFLMGGQRKTRRIQEELGLVFMYSLSMYVEFLSIYVCVILVHFPNFGMPPQQPNNYAMKWINIDFKVWEFNRLAGLGNSTYTHTWMHSKGRSTQVLEASIEKALDLDKTWAFLISE